MKRSTISSQSTSATNVSDFTRRRITPEMPTLRLGDTGDAVITLQQLLARYIKISAIDGIFGPQTELAVRKAQYRMFLPANGIVTPQTWDVFSLGIPIGLPILQVGSQGDPVSWVQEILANMGLYSKATDQCADGDFSPQMEIAVCRYQFSRNLSDTDGVIREQTWSALAGDRLGVTHWIDAECV